MQTADQPREAPGERVVTRRAPSATESMALWFAWTVAKHVRSNAIVLARAEEAVTPPADEPVRSPRAEREVAAVQAEEVRVRAESLRLATQ